MSSVSDAPACVAHQPSQWPPQEGTRDVISGAEAKASVRSRRLSALVRDPEPLFEDCHQRMHDLKQEAAMQRAHVDQQRKQDGDLIRRLQSEFSLGVAASQKKNPRKEKAMAQENIPSQGKGLHTLARPRRSGANPLCEIMPQVQLLPPAEKKMDSRSHIIDRLMRQANVSTVVPKLKIPVPEPSTARSNGLKKPRSARTASTDSVRARRMPSTDSVRGRRAASTDSVRGRRAPSTESVRARRTGSHTDRLGQARGPKPQRQMTPRGHAKAAPQMGLLQQLTPAGLADCISSSGTDLLFAALRDAEGGSGALVKAELVGLLLVLVAHGFPQACSREEELLMELKSVLGNLYEAAEWTNVQESEQFRELPTRLCEGCVCFTAHGELKRKLCEAPEILQAILEFMCDADLSVPSVAFAVISFLFNLCRGHGDLESLGGTWAMLLSGLRQDGLLGLLYSDVLVAADPGSPELAASFRTALCTPSTPDASPLAATLIARCAERCPSTHCLAALTLSLLCLEPEHRVTLATTTAGQVVNTLLELTETVDEAIYVGLLQTLAQVCITADPGLIAIDDQIRSISPFAQLMRHTDEQLQLEGAMGLTNLLTTGDEVRSMALEAGSWGLCQELMFSENQDVRRAVTEAMCNFTAAQEVVDYFACGQGDLELQGFTSFCGAPDHGTQVAATGALAMLARHPKVALRIASGARCQRLLDVFKECEDSDIQHRVASCLNGIYHAPGLSGELHQLIHAAFEEKQANEGFVSGEAEALASSILEEQAEALASSILEEQA